LPEDRIPTVIGKAATDPLNKADLEDPSNRRISILLLREETPAAPLNRKQSKKQRDSYAPRCENRNGAQSSRKPILAPVRGSQDSAVDGEDDIDPMEEPLFKEMAPQIEGVEKAEKVEKIEKLEPAEKTRRKHQDERAQSRDRNSAGGGVGARGGAGARSG
jgi:hypothetical protein